MTYLFSFGIVKRSSRIKNSFLCKPKCLAEIAKCFSRAFNAGLNFMETFHKRKNLLFEREMSLNRMQGNGRKKEAATYLHFTVRYKIKFVANQNYRNSGFIISETGTN